MEVILSLDTEDLDKAQKAIKEYGNNVSHIKLGPIPLAFLPFKYLEELGENHNIMLDLKWFDIPNTVTTALRGFSKLFPKLDLVTVHAIASESMLKAAQDSFNGTILCLLSLSSDEVRNYEINNRLEKCLNLGLKGFVCPPSFINDLSKIAPNTIRVVPGIRNDTNKNDHTITLNAVEAKNLGATHIVVGRPLITNPNINKLKEFKV